MKKHDSLSLSGLAAKEAVVLLLAVSLAAGLYTAPKRLDGERLMTTWDNFEEAAILALPLVFMAFGSFVLLVKL